MSLIDSSLIEECATDASMDRIAEVLKENGYKVVRTRMQITAKRESFWSSKASTITIIDCDNYRQCKDVETSKGLAIKPNSGVLAELIEKAERE